MNGKQLKELASKFDDEDVIYVSWYAKDEADEHIEGNLNDDLEIVIDPLSIDEWDFVVRSMNKDQHLSEDTYESFRYYTEQAVSNRKKAKNGN